MEETDEGKLRLADLTRRTRDIMSWWGDVC